MSSGSESDHDYVPEEPVQVSEEESADEETNLQYEKEVEHKSKKRKAGKISNGKKKINTKNGVKDIPTKYDEEVEPVSQNPEEEKKREDDLWAKFLEGTDTKPKSTVKEPSNIQTNTISSDVLVPTKNAISTKEKEDDKEKERRIFEFAGETIVVENNIIKEKIKTPDIAPTASKQGGTSRSRGGLSSVLGQLNKKNNLSTLEKTKLDWNTYKKEEGVEEEIASHNKGKDGYLDRCDFLERADLRQYEIERDLRMSKRSKR